MLAPQDVDFVIAHAGCPDGFGAAWTAWTMHGNKIDYYFASYADKELPDVRGRNVLMVDFAYKDPEIMNKLNKDANKMLLLDHHKTAKEALDGKIDCDYVFDMERSGAKMAWDFFYPGKTAPLLILYVEDRDIWKWEMTESKAYLAALDSYPYTFSTWSWIASLAGDHLEDFFAEGRAIMRFQQRLTNNAVDRAVTAYLIAPDGTKHICKVVNASSKEIISDVGHELAKQNGMIGAIWAHAHDLGTNFISLRSVGNLDVGEVAQKFGGGGHKNASGFTYSGGIHDIFKEVLLPY